jgi:outer membrane murein-binding lipoprotein Lpp
MNHILSAVFASAVLLSGCTTFEEGGKPAGTKKIPLSEAKKLMVTTSTATDYKYKVQHPNAKAVFAEWAELNNTKLDWQVNYDLLLAGGFSKIQATELNHAIKQINGVMEILGEDLVAIQSDSKLTVGSRTLLAGNPQVRLMALDKIKYAVDASHKTFFPLLLEWSKNSLKPITYNGTKIDDPKTVSFFDAPLPKEAYSIVSESLKQSLEMLNDSYRPFLTQHQLSFNESDNTIAIEAGSRSWFNSPIPKNNLSVVEPSTKTNLSLAKVNLLKMDSTIGLINLLAKDAGYALVLNDSLVSADFPNHAVPYIDLTLTTEQKQLKLDKPGIRNSLSVLAQSFDSDQLKNVSFVLTIDEANKQIHIKTSAK